MTNGYLPKKMIPFWSRYIKALNYRQMNNLLYQSQDFRGFFSQAQRIWDLKYKADLSRRNTTRKIDLGITSKPILTLRSPVLSFRIVQSSLKPRFSTTDCGITLLFQKINCRLFNSYLEQNWSLLTKVCLKIQRLAP